MDEKLAAVDRILVCFGAANHREDTDLAQAVAVTFVVVDPYFAGYLEFVGFMHGDGIVGTAIFYITHLNGIGIFYKSAENIGRLVSDPVSGILNGEVPPEAVTVMVPLASPLQVTLVAASVMVNSGVR